VNPLVASDVQDASFEVIVDVGWLRLVDVNVLSRASPLMTASISSAAVDVAVAPVAETGREAPIAQDSDWIPLQ
jgi:hypothetical protein